MPEFPEVYEQALYLRKRCTGFRIMDAGLLPRGAPLGVKTPAARKRMAKQLLEGRRIENIYQRGKLVILALERGTLISHLMYRGRWSLEHDPFIGSYKHFAKPPTQSSQSLWLANHAGERLAFYSPQNLEWVRFQPAPADCDLPELKGMGPELMRTSLTLPDAPIWSLASFSRKAAASQRPILDFLLDQDKVAGLGRRYAAAAIDAAETSARKRASSLSQPELRRILQAARKVARPKLNAKSR